MFLLFHLYGCGENNTVNKEPAETISFNIDDLISNNKPIYLSDLFFNPQIIPLETTEDSKLSMLKSIKIVDDTIIVMDKFSSGIYLFSSEGNYINKIHKRGKGPGEYLNIYDFDVNKNDASRDIYVLTGEKRIFTYNKQAVFLREIKLEESFNSFALTKKGIYLYRDFPHPGSKNKDLICFLDYEGKRKFSTLNSNSMEVPQVTEKHGNNFSSFNDNIKFFRRYSNTIYSAESKSLVPYLTLNSEKYKFTQKDMERILSKNPNNYVKQLNELMTTEKLTSIGNFSENNDLAYFTFQIGIKRYFAFYKFNTKVIHCSNSIIDDLTYLDPEIYGISDERLIAFVNSADINLIKDYVNSRKIKLNEAEKRLLMNSESNPFIILYEIKKN